MKKILFALLLFSSPVYAYNVTGSVGYGLDQVGVQASSDVVIPGATGDVLKVSGDGTWTVGPVTATATPAGSNTEIQFNNSGALGASNRFKWDGSKMFVSGDGTGVLGAIHVQRGDVANQYAVYQESTVSPGSVFHTFKGSGGNAIAMGALFSGGSPVGYTFTDASGNEQVGINTASGNLIVSSDVVVNGSSVCRANGTNCPSGSTVPTGTGFFHVNAGNADAAARAVNLNSADVTGVLPLANMGSPTSTGFTHINNGNRDTVARAVNLASSDVAGILPITNLSENNSAIALSFIIDGGGSAITTGQKGYFEIPYAMDITGWTVLGDQSGSIQLDLWKDTYANFPPTVADTITGSEKPKLTSQVASQDLVLTTWTKSITSGDVIAVSVDSVATVQRVTLALRGRKTS